MQYIDLYLPDHPMARSNGHIREHRLVTAEKLGRDLRSDEVVHHINGDDKDNRPENLEVLTEREHLKLHWTEGLYQKNCERIGKVYCKICGEYKEHRGLGLCITCYPREWYRKKIQAMGRELRPRASSPKGLIVCVGCGKLVELEAKNMCTKCYHRIKYRLKKGIPLDSPVNLSRSHVRRKV